MNNFRFREILPQSTPGRHRTEKQPSTVVQERRRVRGQSERKVAVFLYFILAECPVFGLTATADAEETITS